MKEKTIIGFSEKEIFNQLSGVRQKSVFTHLTLLEKNKSESVKVISEKLGVDIVTVTKALDSLIEKDVVKRDKNISNVFSYSINYDKKKPKS